MSPRRNVAVISANPTMIVRTIAIPGSSLHVLVQRVRWLGRETDWPPLDGTSGGHGLRTVAPRPVVVPPSASTSPGCHRLSHRSGSPPRSGPLRESNDISLGDATGCQEVLKQLPGAWQDHEPPAPLSRPHDVRADRVDEELHVRALFATEPEMESEVRRRIEHALSGRWQFPGGFATPWRVQA